MSVEFVVGEVGFGPSIEPAAEFHKARCEQLELHVKDLEAQVAELIRHRNRLREVLMRCAALSPGVSDAKHEVLLSTDPKNH